MRACALGLALVCWALTGCKDEVEVVPLPAEGTGGAGFEYGLDAEAPSADGELIPGEIIKRGIVQGRVRQLGPESVIVDDDKGRRFYLGLSPHTVVRQNGAPSSALDFEVGDPLKVWFINENDDFTATRVDVLPAPPPKG